MTKKNVAKTLEERMIEAFRMGHNGGVSIHPEIDAVQGEIRVPRDLSGQSFSVRVLVLFLRRLLLIEVCPQTTSAA